jgi:hypothetical protein
LAFFRNDTVNWLNLHYGCHALAISGGGAFYGAFLLKAGVPAPVVLAARALVLLGRFVIRPWLLAPAIRWGLKPLVIAGTVVCSLQYPLLARVHGVGPDLLILCLVSSAGDCIYWTSYHAYFASLGDVEHRGHQIGAREAMAAMMGIIGPLAAGWALAELGPDIAFGANAAVMLIAALPLLAAPNVAVARQAPGAFRASAPGMMMFFADGWATAGAITVWQIALFISLGRSYTAYGGAMALAGLAGAAIGLGLGRMLDRGHGPRAVWLAAAVYAAVVGLRAASSGNPVLAVVANAAGALIPAFYIPTLMTAIYTWPRPRPARCGSTSRPKAAGTAGPLAVSWPARRCFGSGRRFGLRSCWRSAAPSRSRRCCAATILAWPSVTAECACGFCADYALESNI